RWFPVVARRAVAVPSWTSPTAEAFGSESVARATALVKSRRRVGPAPFVRPAASAAGGREAVDGAGTGFAGANRSRWTGIPSRSQTSLTWSRVSDCWPLTTRDTQLWL